MILVVVVMPYLAFGQPGANDDTFNRNDPGYSSYGTGEVFDLAVRPDGKIYIAGWISSYNGVERTRLARLNPDGILDDSFNSGNVLDYGPRTSVEIQTDGKVLTAGYNTYSVIRLNSDGTVDQGFQNGSTWNWDYTSAGVVYALKCQPDGKVLVGGDFNYYNGYSRKGLIRLESNGTRDISFTVPSDCYGIRAIAVQPDGRVLIAGGFISYGGVPRSMVARLNPDGSLDTSFDPGLGANAIVRCMALLPDGRIVLGGDFVSFNGVACNRLIRLDAQGNIDPNFDPALGPNGPVSSMAIQPDGRMIIAGNFTNCSGGICRNVARLEPDGSLDDSFDQVSGPDGEVHALGLQPDGMVLVAGAFTDYDGWFKPGISRLWSTGEVDQDFNPSDQANGAIHGVAVRADESVVVAGYFTAIGAVRRGRIARLQRDGQLDLGFDPGLGADQDIWSMAMQADERIIIGGQFSTYDGRPRRGVARVNLDGSCDTTFQIGSGANGQVIGVGVGPDNKVLVSGGFSSFNGVDRRRIVLLNEDGSVDLAFDPGDGPNSSVMAHAWRPDGKILIFGSFTSYRGIARKHCALLNRDGSVDTGFDPGLGPDQRVVSAALQPDGKILIGGFFDNVHGVTRNGIARLHPDGSLDNSFDPGTGIQGQASGWNRVYSIIPQPDGKLIIGGDFMSYNGVARSRIARLNADGSLDVFFDPNGGANDIIIDMHLLQDGKLLIAGYFTRYGGAKRSHIARVLGGNDMRGNSPMYAYPNPVSSGQTISFALDPQAISSSTGSLSFRVTDTSGRIVDEQTIGSYQPWLNIEVRWAAGLYQVGLWDDSLFIGSCKFVVE
jgi:uncharacterized delta-60 repeat protein